MSLVQRLLEDKIDLRDSWVETLIKEFPHAKAAGNYSVNIGSYQVRVRDGSPATCTIKGLGALVTITGTTEQIRETTIKILKGVGA